MKWDIFGNRKLNRLGERQDTILADIANLDSTIKALSQEINQLGDKFGKLIEELKKVQVMAEIPMVKPRLRNPEDVYKKEKAQESEFTNLFRL